MRGHGATVTGGTMRQAVFRAVYTDVNARLQAQALRLGTPLYLTEEEAAAAAATNDGQIDRSWDLWLREIPSARFPACSGIIQRVCAMI